MEVSTNRKIHWSILVSIFPLTIGIRYIWRYFQKISETNDGNLVEQQLKTVLEVLESSDSEIEITDYEVVVNANTSLHCIGTITSIENDYGLVDEKFYFKVIGPSNLQLGDRVTFTVYKLNGSDTEVVKNVKKYSDDCWEGTSKTYDNTKIVVKNSSQILKRNIVGQITNRQERKLFIQPPDITVSLDDIESNFIPFTGDWVVLDAFTEVDESVSDLSGKILSVKRIYPLRAKPKIGVIKSWNPISQDGVIDNNIYFQKDNCEAGYIPFVGDKIVSEIIESNQGSYPWRALTVSPNLSNLEPVVNNFNDEIDKLVIDKNGITITENLEFSAMKLHEKRRLKVAITNSSKQQHRIIRCYFHSKKPLSQIVLLSHDINNEVLLNPNDTVMFEFECEGKFLGKSRELFIFVFKDFKIGRWFLIDVINDLANCNNSNTYVTKAYGNLVKKVIENRKGDVFRGVRLVKPPAFVPVKMGLYYVPNKFFDMILTNENKLFEEIIIDIEKLLSCFQTDLNFNNYNNRFHHLLYFEEIQMTVDIHSYDIERARFIVNGEYLMLEISNLRERRPSLIVGDRVIAIDPWNSDSQKYEGFIHKIQAKHIYLKFTPTFHTAYQGQDYNIEFTFMRTSLRRCHQAVGLAIKNLGKDFLFPSAVKEKQPQKNCTDYTVQWCNKQLNDYQKQAIVNILKGIARPLPYIIFGPPGTGKTVTLVEAALQIIKMVPGSRLLIASPSNSSADLLATRLLESKILAPGDVVRLVAHRRVIEGTIPEHLLPYCATGDLAREGTTSSKQSSNGQVRMGCSSSVLGRHRITVSTCICLGQLYNMGFAKGHFTHVLVDEAGQATEPEILIPLSLFDTQTGQVILAGDPLQLGPIVISKIARHYGMDESILVRLTRRFPYERDLQGFPKTGGYDPRLITRLAMNYRSVPEILNLPSKLFYDAELQPQISQTEGKQADILKLLANELPRRDVGGPPAVVFHGIRGENYQQADCPSWYNPHEAVQVFYYLNCLYNAGITADDIGIITPYIKQVKEIRKLIQEKELDLPKVSSVEDFQGQERNVIILSTVRSTSTLISTDVKYFLGFISSPKRLNVALTRAQALLIIVGNPHTLAIDPFWRSVLLYCVENNAYTGCDLPTEYMSVNN